MRKIINYMDLKFFNFLSQRYFLPIFLLILVVLSNTPINFYGELNYLELIQVLVLIISLTLQVVYKKLFLKGSNKVSYFARLSMFIFLLYEELSFITEGKIQIFNIISTQSEANFHNNKLLFKNFISYTIPFINQTAVLNGYVLGISIFLLILGFGSYFKFLNKFRYFFLERKFAIYTQLFIINYLLSGLLSSIKPDLKFLYGEFFEFFIYFILLMDILEKKKIFSKMFQNYSS